MKKLYSTIALTAVAVFSLSGCTASSGVAPTIAANVDVKNECSVEANGIEKVLASATKYNTEAKVKGLEFMRLGMKTSQYIDGAMAAVKSGSKTVDIVDKKKKKKGTVSTEYAAWRACSFAVRALQQSDEAHATWKLAVPGDGYKY